MKNSILESTERKLQFQNQGFLHVPAALSTVEINELLTVTEAILKEDRSSDILKNENGVVRKLCYVFDKNPIFLAYLAHPSILGLAIELAEKPELLVPTWEDMLIKAPITGIPVTIHQDLALQTIYGHVFSIGIYLHSSNENPVYYLPGSHVLGPQTRDQIRKIWAERKAEFVPVYAERGDLVVHNVLTVHYSETNTSTLPRYTWYIEFRNLHELLNDGIWPVEWCMGRRALLFDAIIARQKNGLAVPEYSFIDESALRLFVDQAIRRFPHETDTVSYDILSPFNHFVD